MKKLLALEDLTEEESQILFTSLLSMPIERQAAVLTLLRAKKETKEEILGALKYFTNFSSVVKSPFSVCVVDIVGTGGDAANTFNISTAASLVMASLGLKVAKHGGGRSSSKSGSLDVVDHLAIRTPQHTAEVPYFLEKYNYAFLRAPLFNSQLKDFAPLRKALGFPTIFNLLGPLLNPLKPKKQIIGVYRKDLIDTFISLLKSFGIIHALVVHSEDGLDEISISAPTYIGELRDGEIKTYKIAPKDFGITEASLREVLGGESKDNAHIIEKIFLNEERGSKLDIVAVNAGAGLYVGGIAKDIFAGTAMAKKAISDGKPWFLLNQLKERKVA